MGSHLNISSVAVYWQKVNILSPGMQYYKQGEKRRCGVNYRIGYGAGGLATVLNRLGPYMSVVSLQQFNNVS